MKEQIYTIPLNDAFGEDCECPLCYLENKLEEDLINYYLGPSLMEPDHRLVTNQKGFCRRHFEMLYSRQENTLGLALIIETHMEHLLGKLKEGVRKELSFLRKQADAPAIEKIKSLVSKKKDSSPDSPDRLSRMLAGIRKECALCDKLNFTMGRYIDVMFYLWKTEPEFRNKFNACKGFCLFHLESVLDAADKYLGAGQRKVFAEKLLEIQLNNMDRILDEVKWFTKKFDYRYKDEPWKNSKDAVPRSIQKITTFLRKR